MAWASALTMVCDLGLNVLLTREVAKPGSAGRRLLAAAVLAKLLLAPIGLLVFWAAPWVGIEAESTAALRGAVFLAAAGAAYGCFAAVFRGVEWFIPLVVMETAGLAVQLLGSVWIVWSGGTVLDLVVLAFAVQMVQLSVAAGLWQLWAPPRGRLVPPSWGLAGRMIRRSLPFAAAGLVATVQGRSSPLLLGYLGSQSGLGRFGAAWRLGELAKLIPHGIFGAALPVLAHETGKDPSQIRKLLPRFERGLLALTLAIATLLVAFADPILRWTYGAQFAPASPTLVWLALGLVPALMNSERRVYLYASGDERYAVRLSAIGLALQLLASVPMIVTFGPSGAAVSIALGEAAVWFPLRRRSRGERIRGQNLELGIHRVATLETQVQNSPSLASATHARRSS